MSTWSPPQPTGGFWLAELHFEAGPAEQPPARIGAIPDDHTSCEVQRREKNFQKYLTVQTIDGVFDRWGLPDQHLIHRETVEWFRHQEFAAGSMAPKVEAGCRFVEETGRPAYIGGLESAVEILAGRAGTVIEPVPTGVVSKA